MEFLNVCENVKTHLKQMPLEEKVILFKDFFRSPINYKDGTFFYSGLSSNKTEVSAYLQIREHWMSMQEFDRLNDYFTNLDKLDK